MNDARTGHSPAPAPDPRPPGPEYMTPPGLAFRAADPYRMSLHAPSPECIRQRVDDRDLTERHLQCIWFDSTLRPPVLTDRNGMRVTVEDPGRWNLEAGPDFLDARLCVISPDGTSRTLCGDVEVHIHPRDWKRHGHDTHPRYHRVIAHVTYHAAKRESAAPLPPDAIEIALRPQLEALGWFSTEAVDLDAYPYEANREGYPCARMLENRDCEQQKAFLNAAGAYRLECTSVRLAGAMLQSDPDTVLYRETLAALGYRPYRAAFRQLALRIPPDELSKRPHMDAYALLLGVAGLLPPTLSSRHPPETRDFIRRLWDAWWPLQARWDDRRMPAEAWPPATVRPQNHPARRLAAAATLFAGGQAPLSRRMDDAWNANRPVASLSPLFHPVAPLDYWLHHLTPGSSRRRTPLALAGPGRIAAWINNVVIPWNVATGRQSPETVEKLPTEPANSIIRQTAWRLFGRDHNPSLYNRHGLRQQGLLQIAHDFCLNAGCHACPLPDAIRTQSRVEPRNRMTY